jgi:bacillithiol biosynthesis cysteine-adding enzyme BshC
MNLEMLVGHPSGSPLIDDYVTGRGKARSFFRWDWTDPESYRARAREVTERFDRTSREKVASLLAPNGGGLDERLDRWAREGGLVVTTGQQPGLFTGPLHTTYKAITAVRLAHQLETLLEMPVLPVFWVASEDHDWDEAHDTWIVGVDNDLLRIELPEPPDADREKPLYQITARFDEALDTLLSELPPTDFKQDVEAVVRECWGSGRTNLPDAFRCTIEELLGPSGLLCVDAHDPRLKAASAEVLLAELDGAARHETLLTDRTLELEEAGYHGQVTILPDAVNLLFEGEAGRERLYRDDDGYRLHRSGRRMSVAEVEQAVRAGEPALSPNVLLRPVVETAVLPTIAYVGGPSEIAYFAQLGPLFDAHGAGMPIAVPRRSVMVVEAKVRKVLDKFGLEVGELARPFHELVADIARDELPDEVRDALGGLKGAIARGTAELSNAARMVDPTLKGPINHARGVAFEALAEAEKKILQAVKRENEIALQQLEKARLHLYPDGRPQERVLNVFYYLARYGRGFVTTLLERLDPLPDPDRGG